MIPDLFKDPEQTDDETETVEHQARENDANEHDLLLT